MLERAVRGHALNLRRSFVVGDRYLDIELAHRAGARGILVRTGYGEGELAWHAAQWPRQPDFVAEDLSGAAEWILRQTK
jgi:D-glycero-D-manno-heptose 1,7-bisphosphate phosphatase